MRALVLSVGIAVVAAFTWNAAIAEQQFSSEGRKALKAAMESEAFSAAEYKLFTEHARRTGRKELGDLMEFTANMEYGHFLRWAELYRLVGSDEQNLSKAIGVEHEEDIKLYTRLADEADARGEKELANHFREVKSQEDEIYQRYLTMAQKVHIQN